MAAAIGKLTIIIGAGIVGTVLSKEGRLPNVADFFSGALKIVTRNLQQDKDNSRSSGKPQADSLLSQVNNLRQELQLLASSRPVTIITGSRSGSRTYGVTTVIVVGVVGYGYIWWKGWKLSNLMFVTRRGFSDACAAVGKQLDQVSSSISSAKRHLSSRIDHVDSNIDECMELTTATKDEVSKLHGEISEFHAEFESVHRVVQNLEVKLDRIEGNQDFATQGVYRLCQFVHSFEQSGNKERIQASTSSSRPVLELPQTTPVSKMVSLPPLALESAPPSASRESPKVLRPSTAVSASGLKELQEMSNAIKARSSRSSSIIPSATDGPEGSQSTQEPTNSSSSSWFGLKLPGISLLTRTRSAAG